MKKTLLVLSAFTLLFAACGGSNEQKTETSAASTPPPAASSSDKHPGQILIAKSDCIGCHQKEERIIGPSYEEIATKYPNTEETIVLLAGKVIKGGKGVWGPIPMTPHTKITEDEAKTMIKYILSLKK